MIHSRAVEMLDTVVDIEPSSTTMLRRATPTSNAVVGDLREVLPLSATVDSRDLVVSRIEAMMPLSASRVAFMESLFPSSGDSAFCATAFVSESC